MLESYICLSENSGPGFDKGGPAAIRRGINRFSPTYPQTIYRAADGWIGVTALTPQQWQALCEMIGLPDLARDPAYATTDQRMAAANEIDALLAPALLKHKADDLLLEGQRRRVPLGPVPTTAELLETPHWRERNSFRAFNGKVPAFEGPAMPFRLRARGATGRQRHAPAAMPPPVRIGPARPRPFHGLVGAARRAALCRSRGRRDQGGRLRPPRLVAGLERPRGRAIHPLTRSARTSTP